MLAKLTAKNQLTLPRRAVDAVGAAEYFDVTVQGGQIVLTPVRIQRGDAVRARLSALGLGEADIADAIAWARGTGAAPHVAEPPAAYAKAGGPARSDAASSPRSDAASSPRSGAASSQRKTAGKTSAKSPRRRG